MRSRPVSGSWWSSSYHRPAHPVRLRRRSRWWKWMLATGIGILLVLGWTWKGVYVDALGIEKAKSTLKLEELQGQQKHLKSRLITLRSFARIDKLAREQLHMQYANRPPRILSVPGIDTEKPRRRDTVIDNHSLASVE